MATAAGAGGSSKFAGLHGLAVGQPDVFETPDDEAREVVGLLGTGGSGSDAASAADTTAVGVAAAAGSSSAAQQIDRPAIDASQAFQRFRGQVFAGGSVDFSDVLRSSAAERFVFAGVRERRLLETPAERVSRLAVELAEVQDQMAKLEADAQQTGESVAFQASRVTAADLTAQLAALNTQVEQLQARLAAPGAAATPDVAAATASLRSRVAAVRAAPSADASGSGGADTVDAARSATYELYACGPSTAGGDSPVRAAELEQRLAALEHAIGSTDKAGAPGQLRERIDALDRRLSLLTPAAVDATQRKLQVLAHRMDLLLKQKTAAAETGASLHQDLDALSDRLATCDRIAPLVPALVQRLQTLRSLHEDAAGVASRVAALGASQAGVSDSVAALSSDLSSLQANVSSNLESFLAKIGEIDDRIATMT